MSAGKDTNTPIVVIRDGVIGAELSWYSNISIQHNKFTTSWTNNSVVVKSNYYYAILGT